MGDDVQPAAGNDGLTALSACEARLVACAEELQRTARDTDDLLARSTAQLGECQRLTAIVKQHETTNQLLQVTVQTALHEAARLVGIVAERDRQAAAFEARVAMHEAEYQRLTRLIAERAREISELRLALGTRRIGNSTARDNK